MKLSDYIQGVLNEKNINMTMAAQRAGVSPSTLSRLKSGASDLTPSLAAKLSVVGFDYVKMFELDRDAKITKTREILKTVNG